MFSGICYGQALYSETAKVYVSTGEGDRILYMGDTKVNVRTAGGGTTLVMELSYYPGAEMGMGFYFNKKDYGSYFQNFVKGDNDDGYILGTFNGKIILGFFEDHAKYNTHTMKIYKDTDEKGNKKSDSYLLMFTHEQFWALKRCFVDKGWDSFYIREGLLPKDSFK